MKNMLILKMQMRKGMHVQNLQEDSEQSALFHPTYPRHLLEVFRIWWHNIHLSSRQ